MSRNKFYIGGEVFLTKKSLTERCKSILNSSPIKGILTGSERDIVKGVVNLHYNSKIKTLGKDFEVGVRLCTVNKKNRQFYIKRHNNSTVDFSYVKAIGGIKSKLTQVKEALRWSVVEQVVAYKREYFRLNQDSRGYVICPETLLKVNIRESHLDHYPTTFEEIAHDWVKSLGMSSEDFVIINGGKDGEISLLEDPSLVDSFRSYHYLNANYRVVLNKVNTQRKRPKRFVF